MEQRETVDAVRVLLGDPEKGVTVTEVAKALKIDKSAAWRRVRGAIDEGYLQNREDRKGRPARLIPGDPMPDEEDILPTVDTLIAQGCAVAGGPGEIRTPEPPCVGEGSFGSDVLPPVVRGDRRCNLRQEDGGSDAEAWREAYEERLGILVAEGVPDEQARAMAAESARLATGGHGPMEA